MGDREQAVESWCPKRKVVTIVMNDPNRKRERGCKKTKPFEWSYFSGLEYLVRWPRLQQTVGMGGARIHKHQHKCRQCGHTKLITTRSMVNLKCEGSVWLMSGRRKIKSESVCKRVCICICLCRWKESFLDCTFDNASSAVYKCGCLWLVFVTYVAVIKRCSSCHVRKKWILLLKKISIFISIIYYLRKMLLTVCLFYNYCNNCLDV